MGREPKHYTQRHHASAFNRVLQRAKTQGLITFGMAVPAMRAAGDRGDARPSFSQQEFDQLLSFMPAWVTQARMGRTQRFYEMKMLCWQYVEFLLYTGIRAGTESLSLRKLHAIKMQDRKGNPPVPSKVRNSVIKLISVTKAKVFENRCYTPFTHYKSASTGAECYGNSS